MFFYHWKDERQHVVLAELELKRLDAKLTSDERDVAVDDFIALIVAVDGILRSQAVADVKYFVSNCGRSVGAEELNSLEKQFLKTYRWQYIYSGASHPRFQAILKSLIAESQFKRIEKAVGVLE